MTATFPPLTRAHVLLFQFSSWYPVFRAHSIKSTVIRPLPPDFVNYLHSDGILVPEGSEDSLVSANVFCSEPNNRLRVATSTLSDEEDDDAEKDDSDSEEEQANKFSFPELDAKIRDIIKTYGAVFPKLNFSSPKVPVDSSVTSYVWIIRPEKRLTCLGRCMAFSCFLPTEMHFACRRIHAAQIIRLRHPRFGCS